MENIIRAWINEAKKKKTEKANKSLFVLIGPPAVGKTSWIAANIENENIPFTVISRDQIIEDQIFPKYKLTNNELYALNPPEDAEVGKIIPGMEKFGIVVQRSDGKKNFANSMSANAEKENLIKKEYESAIRIVNQLSEEDPYNIVIDAINATPLERQRVLNKFSSIKNLNKIAVFFKFEPYKEQIAKRAEKRAQDMKKEFGSSFDRAVPTKVYDAIFKRIQKPTEAEGFDDIVSYDSFKGVNAEEFELTSEAATLNFRKFLNEENETDMLEEARLGRIWRSKAKQRAKRHERPYDKDDLKWAHKQQEKWHKSNPELEEFYLKEIEAAKEAAKSTKEYLLKMREIRRKKLEEKGKFKKPTGKLSKKTLPSPYEGEGKETKNFPYKKARTGGVAKVYQRRAKKAVAASQGETIGPGLGAGAAALEEVQISFPQEEKGDGKSRS